MRTRLLTIKTDDQKAYEQLLSNWLTAGAEVIQCGFDDDLEWWAIAKIDPATPEKPCDIAKRTVRKNNDLPEYYWQWGDEEEHTFYYDFPMFGLGVNEEVK